ncbi:hypothetical protein [Saccharopolyspora griseoalba]|uniref:Uncharacterized protein n=1 Tax=Saccharopolyspora griseoalba TaxID=1431848 RepID=A0ABW2LPN3_9PSEU
MSGDDVNGQINSAVALELATEMVQSAAESLAQQPADIVTPALLPDATLLATARRAGELLLHTARLAQRLEVRIKKMPPGPARQQALTALDALAYGLADNIAPFALRLAQTPCEPEAQ